MKAATVVRLYCVFLAALLIGRFINLYQALTRPTVDWFDAAAMRLLAIIFVTLIMLVRARTKTAASPAAFVRIAAGRYVVAGLAAVGLVFAVLLGVRARG
jgi:hypothetical protein